MAKPSERTERLALGGQLKSRRATLRLRQADAAAMIGVSEFTYRNWEHGLYPPPQRYVDAIRTFLIASRVPAKEPGARG